MSHFLSSVRSSRRTREETLLARVLKELGTFPVTDKVVARFEEMVRRQREIIALEEHDASVSLALRRGRLQERLDRLTDVFIDRAIDRDTFDARKRTLEEERLALEGESDTSSKLASFDAKAARSLELLKTLKNLDELAKASELLHTVDSTVSNCTVNGKDVVFAWDPTVQVLFAEEPVLLSAHAHDSYRTLPVEHRPQEDDVVDKRLLRLMNHILEVDAAETEREFS